MHPHIVQTQRQHAEGLPTLPLAQRIAPPTTLLLFCLFGRPLAILQGAYPIIIPTTPPAIPTEPIPLALLLKHLAALLSHSQASRSYLDSWEPKTETKAPAIESVLLGVCEVEALHTLFLINSPANISALRQKRRSYERVELNWQLH